MKNILIIKLGALGDVASGTAMLSAIRQRFPEARVTWMAGTGAAELLSLLREPPEIVRVDDAALLRGSFAQRLAAVFAANRLIAGRVYDLALIPYRDRLYHALCLGAWCKRTRSFRNRRGIIPGRARCAEYARLILEKDDTNMPVPVFPELDASKLPSTIQTPAVLLAPGGARNFLADDAVRRWPLEKYKELARLLLSHGLTVGIIGGKDDVAESAAFAGLPVTNFVGKTDIPGLFGLLREARVLVSHDTGPIHCMNLLQGNVVALFGPTLAREVLGSGTNIRTLSGGDGLPCRPCYDGKHFAACDNALCMQEISPGSVLEAVSAFLR
ncbi:MAG: glycosyltransferase family 9 protein [Desulfovibrionaceae bacterium]|nr:glycosyltransferase family 9 protein [Desulfovibrionaceae bacterium]